MSARVLAGSRLQKIKNASLSCATAWLMLAASFAAAGERPKKEPLTADSPTSEESAKEDPQQQSPENAPTKKDSDKSASKKDAPAKQGDETKVKPKDEPKQPPKPPADAKESNDEQSDDKKSNGGSAEPASLSAAFDPKWINVLKWRSIGPATMGGRIVDLAVVESDPYTFFVATASGGLFKTTNNGTTFEPVFDKQTSISIGDVCVAPSDPNTVWVGTGEHNGRNSVSWGDGVYKSTDGGKTWRHMGLKESFQIGRIAIDPRDRDVVYVGALGRLWGPNKERGLFKTTDGGKTWERILYVDDKTGCIEVQIHPTNPDTLIAAMYERQRDSFDGGDPAKRWGPGGGLYKTTDGGRTWKRLNKNILAEDEGEKDGKDPREAEKEPVDAEDARDAAEVEMERKKREAARLNRIKELQKLGNGLPTVNLGRIGVAYYRRNPNVVYAVIETEKIGTGRFNPAYMGITGTRSNDALLRTVAENGPAAKAGLKDGDVVVRIGDVEIESYNDLVLQIRKHQAGDKVQIVVKRRDQDGNMRELEPMELTFGERPQQPGQQGQLSRRPFASNLGGQRANAQDLQREEGFQTGGVFKSTDGGETWQRVNSLNPRPFYYSQIHVDPSDDRYIYVLGIYLHASSDGGQTFRQDAGSGVHPDHHAMWINPRDGRHIILGCDGGLYVTHDRTRTWEFDNIMAIGQFYDVGVDVRNPYRVYGGLQDNGSWGGPSRTRGRGPDNADWVRVGGADGFICRSDPNDPDLVYYEGQYGMMGRVNVRTGERGRIRPAQQRGVRYRFNWKTPFLLSRHNSRIFYCGAQFVFRSLDRGDNLKRISDEITRTNRGSATALAESPHDPDVLYVGTDDGLLWITRDGGKEWTELSEKFNLPGPRQVNSIEYSRFEPGRAYVVFDGHRSDDDAPYVFVTEDYGKSWQSLVANLPEHTTRVLREDIENSNLLYLGTEFGIWCSFDRGLSWHELNSNLPTVAIHEIAVHPTAGEIVAATHGRSLWVLDVSPLRQVTKEVRDNEAHLFKPNAAVHWAGVLGRSHSGHSYFRGENPSGGARLFYFLRNEAKDVDLRITDVQGKVVRELRAAKAPGLHNVGWDLRQAARQPRDPRFRFGPPAAAGKYLVTLSVDGKKYSQPLEVQADPEFPAAMLQEELEEFESKKRAIILD